MSSNDETWSIQEVARRAGTTSRALRHYQAEGLLEPTEIGSNGYRRYGADALVRLQRILLLRELGLALPDIARILDDHVDPACALRSHVGVLGQERERLTRQIAAVERTIASIEEGKTPMAQDMFDGFDHTVHEEEVTRRWGAEAYASSSAWWEGMAAAEKEEWLAQSRGLAHDWIAAARGGVEPDSAEAESLAARHVAWLSAIPGTPGAGGVPERDYIRGLAEMYVADERFAATYGGPESAVFVRDALVAYAGRHL